MIIVMVCLKLTQQDAIDSFNQSIEDRQRSGPRAMIFARRSVTEHSCEDGGRNTESNAFAMGILESHIQKPPLCIV